MSDNPRVMLVDDHDVVRQGLRYLIEAAGDAVVVAEASSGAEAVEAARLHHPDVVLMDVRMPGGDGIEACREIRNDDAGVHVVMLTAFPDDEAMFNSVMAGAAGFVLKQVHAPELVQVIHDAAA